MYLDTDIDFSDKSLDVIGNYFSQGTLDGQGHIISNLKINSDAQEVGLFGYSTGLTIKNVVIDDTCSISSYCSGHPYVGGIIGRYYAYEGNCNIENIVNMGNVTHGGNSESETYLGGIVGKLSSSSNYGSYVKNCVNYGAVTHSGESRLWDKSVIGGIVGCSDGYSSEKLAYIQNCLNYGAIITHSDTDPSPIVGGIVGYAGDSKIENCVSAGIISNYVSYAGGIVGSINSDSYISNCFWTSDTGYIYANGTGSPTIDNVEQITDNSETLDNLNIYSGTYAWNGWVLNKNNDSVTFTVNNTKGFTLNSQIILLPSLKSEGESLFDGWYRDRDCTTPFDDNEITEGFTLYAKYENNESDSFSTGVTPLSILCLSLIILSIF